MTTKTQNRHSAAAMAALLLVFGASTANARSWRINNDETKKANFTSINAAMSSEDVQAGDTLYLDPGCVIASQTISKRVTLIGTGYLSKAHPTAYITNGLSISAANTKVEGVYCTGSISVTANYVTLERCKIDTYISTSNRAAQYVSIRQCLIGDYITGRGTTSNETLGWTIEGCIIRSGNSDGSVRSLYNPIIRNNYILNTSTNTSTAWSPSALRNITGGLIENNVLLNAKNTRAQTLWSVENSTVQRNVMSCDETKYAATYPDNICLDLGYAEAEPVVFAKTGEDMNIYRLADDSPAKGAGVGGEDCGPFGGAMPFVVYGRPYGIPYWIESQVGTRAIDGKVNIKQKVMMQND